MSTTLDLLRDADALIRSCEGLDPEAMDAALAAWVDGAANKAAALQAVVSRADSQKEYLTGEAAALTAAADQQAAIAERCRRLIVSLLRKQEELGEKPIIRGPGWSMSLRRSEAVEISDPDAIPPEYLRVKTTKEPDKGAIKAAITEGLTVRGAVVVRRDSVTIRKQGA